MELELYRDPSKCGITLGQLSINGIFECYTLERPLTGEAIVAIPALVYPVTLGWSKHFQRIVPRINDVPGRSDIEIHFGNFVTNTTGCILVGEHKEATMILNSIKAFDQLLEKLRKAAVEEAVTLKVINPIGLTPAHA